MAKTQDGRIVQEMVIDGPNSGQGSTPFTLVSAASNNLTLVKATPAQALGNPGAGGVRLFTFDALNTAATAHFVKVFDAASAANVNMGTTVPKLNIGIPASAPKVIDFASLGCQFTNGIVIAITGGSALLDNTAVAAGDVILNLCAD